MLNKFEMLQMGVSGVHFASIVRVKALGSAHSVWARRDSDRRWPMLPDSVCEQ